MVAPVIQLIVADKQIIRLRQHRPGLLRQEGMLKVSCIVASRRKDNIDAAGVDIIHGLPQQLPIIAVIHHLVLPEGFRAAAAAEIPGNQRIRGTGRNAEIVLQNIPYAILAQYQIYT